MKRYLLYSLFALPAAFLALAGTVLLSEGVLMSRHYLQPWEKTYHQRFSDPRTQILAHAILAPNGHNLQNWKFVYERGNPNGLNVYMETSRLATTVDPFHTQATISQGTMFEYLSLAARKLGYSLKAELFPDGEYSQHAPVSELDRKRVAHVELVPCLRQQDGLYDEMFKPDTSRVAYKRGTLTREQVRVLSALDLPELRIQYIGEGEDHEHLKQYILESAKVETGVSGVMQESQQLFRVNEKEKNTYRFGFSFEGSAVPIWKMHLLQGLLTLVPDMNDAEVARKDFLEQTAMAADRNAGFFLILAEKNTRLNQFNAGRLYSRMQLKAHTMNMAVQPLSQAIEEYPAMSVIFQDIHRDFAQGNESILMVFRIGVPEKGVPKSMRMNVENLIRQ